MKKFFSQTIEIKALIISIIATILGFLGTIFLFWYKRGDIPFGVLTGGGIIILGWLILYLSKIVIFLRLTLLVISAATFAILRLQLDLYIISPISLIITYLVVSLLTLIAHIGKDKNA